LAQSLGSYGSLARFRDVKRIVTAGSQTLVGGSGDMSDFSHIEHMLEDVVTENENWCGKLRHYSYLDHFSSVSQAIHHPSRAVGRALLITHAYGMLIGLAMPDSRL